MRFVLVESPYTTTNANRQECIRYALWCCADCDARGEACFASHLFYTQFIPESKEGRNRGLAYRDEVARRTLAKICRYTDLGTSPGMFRERDGSAAQENRTLTGTIREKWLAGEWPEGSYAISRG